MQALLNIYEYFLEETIIRCNPDYKKREKEKSGEINITFDIKRKEQEPLFMISMRIELNKNKKVFDQSPYYIFLNINGFFRFPRGTPEDIINKMIGLNGPAILYGVARGLTSQITANGRHGKFILPAINFVELINEMKKKKSRKRAPNMQLEKTA